MNTHSEITRKVCPENKRFHMQVSLFRMTNILTAQK